MSVTTGASLGWLHISDLHFLENSSWRDSQPLKKLLDDLDGLLKSGLRIDLVLCTGDIGFGETKTEPLADQYAEAKIFFDKVLETCKLSYDRLFLVPGNHDIDRNKVRNSQTEWFRASQRNSAHINQYFQNKDPEIQGAMERLGAYQLFIKENYPHIHLDENITFGALVEINQISIAISGLNSAWSCADNADKNQIWLAGEAQLYASSKAIDTLTSGSRPHLRIGLLHHPQDWLQPLEAQELRGRLQQDFDFLLHGHAHDQWVHEISLPQHAVIAAGASTGESASEFGYNLVQLSPDKAKVHLRRYDKKGCGWIEENIHGRTTSGVWALTPMTNLPVPTPAPSSISVTQITAKTTPLNRGHFGLDRALGDCSKQLEKNRLLAVFGMAGVGKSILVEELCLLPQWRNHRLVPIIAREGSGIADFFGQLAPLLGMHDERPRPPIGETAVKMANALHQIAPVLPPLFIHVQRAHLWFNHGHWLDTTLARLLEGLVRAYPEITIVLETREQPVVDLSCYEVIGLPKQVLGDYLANPPGLTESWVLKREERDYLFSRLGGGHGRGAHAYGLVLLVRLAAAKSTSPYEVLKQYPYDYAEELYNKLFRDLYENVLGEAERSLLFACSLYRDGIHYRHLPCLEEALNIQDAASALIRRRLLTESSDWFHLHDLVTEQARRLAPEEHRTQALHQVIGSLWLDELKGQKNLIEANIRRALEALYHLEQGGQGERVVEVAPILFGRRPEETVKALWRMNDRYFASPRQDDKVRAILEYLLKVSPREHRAMRFLGECRRRLYGAKDQEALQLFRQSVHIDPNYPQYWANYGHAAIASDNSKILDIFLVELAGAPERARDDHVVAIQALALAAGGRDEEAATLRQRKISEGRCQPAFYADHAKWLLDKKDDLDAALQVLELAQQRGDADAFTDAIYASALEKAGRDDEAKDLRERKISEGSRDAAFYVDHAKWLLNKQSAADAALKVLKLARQRGVNSAFIDAIYATALVKAGRDDEAAELRQQEIFKLSRNPAFYADQAKWLLDKQDDADAAFKVLQLARQRGCFDKATEAIHERVIQKQSK